MKTTNHAEQVHSDETRSEESSHVHQSGIVRVAKRSAPEHEIGASMVDALDDILKWERQSERHLRIADDQAS